MIRRVYKRQRVYYDHLLDITNGWNADKYYTFLVLVRVVIGKSDGKCLSYTPIRYRLESTSTYVKETMGTIDAR